MKDLNKSVNDLLRTSLKKTGTYINTLKTVFKYLPNEFKPRLLSIYGRYNIRIGNYKAALKFYRDALLLFEKNRNYEHAALLRMGMIDVYMFLGNYDDALRIGKKSLSYFRRNNMTSFAGKVLNNIGNIYHRMDNNRMALSYYNKAKEVFKKSGGVPLAVIEFNLANIYSNMNKIKQAESLYLKSAEIYRQNSMELAENQAIYSLAYLYYLEDRYTDAIKAFEKLHDKLNNLGDYKFAALTQLDLIEINIQLNQYGSAIMLAEELIPRLRKLGMFYEKAKAYYFSAIAHTKLGDYKIGASRLKKSEVIFAREKNYLWRGMVYMARCKLYTFDGKFSAAIEAANKAIKYFTKSGDKRRKIDAEISRVKIFIYSQDYVAATKLAAKITSKKLVNYQNYDINCLLGKCYYIQKDYRTALKYLRVSVLLIEKMLVGLYPDEIRHFFIADKIDSYNMMIKCLLKLNKVHESFLINLKALEIINQRFSAQKSHLNEIPANLLKIRSELKSALKKLALFPESGYRAVKGTTEYYSIEQKLWSNERKIRSVLYPDKTKEKGLKGKPSEYLKLLKNNETLISFYSFDNLVGAFIACKNEYNFIKLDINSDELNILIRKLHYVFESAVFGTRNYGKTSTIAISFLEQIHSIIFEPLEKYIAGKKVLILADGVFGQIPYMALRDGNGKYLKDNYKIKMIANPDNLKSRLSSKDFEAESPGAIFAASSSKLPMIEIEAKEIRKRFRKSRLYIKKNANCTNLSKELNQKNRFVHIAAHASRSSENPLFSRILLNDGPFFPFDLFKSNIKANLVTLSGCQTAAPGLYYGNSYSLAKAFYQAGAECVLASLWPVSDRISKIFMKEFYHDLAETGSIDNAYNKAINKITKVTDNPAFWGAFILLGI